MQNLDLAGGSSVFHILGICAKTPKLDCRKLKGLRGWAAEDYGNGNGTDLYCFGVLSSADGSGTGN